MTAVGHERRFRDPWLISAYPSIADIRVDIAFRHSGPAADIGASVDHWAPTSIWRYVYSQAGPQL
jgi:hypothetical protein